MSKKVSFSTKPVPEKPPVDADQWVQHRTAEGIKRVTLTIPSSLHTRMRISCFKRGTTIADEVRALLEERFKEDTSM